MSQLTASELYEWFVATIEESSSSVLLLPDDVIERRLLEDFDIDSRTFLHDDNLHVLLSSGLISEETFTLARQLRAYAIALRDSDAWTIASIRSAANEWPLLLSLSDQILAQIHSSPR